MTLYLLTLLYSLLVIVVVNCNLIYIIHLSSLLLYKVHCTPSVTLIMIIIRVPNHVQ